jgi:clan AA aspartic protease
MVKGEFIENLPCVNVNIGWGQAVQSPTFVLDTGFTGDLQVSYDIARELNLNIVGVIPTKIADGKIVNMPTAVAIASMEGQKEYVEVFVSEGSPLLGIGFLSKFSYKATIDCKYKAVFLERVE